MADKDKNDLQENEKKTFKQKLKEIFPGLDRTYPRRAREIGRIKDVYNGPEPLAAVYAGPDFFEKKKKPDVTAMCGVYAGPDQMAEVPIMEDVYAGPPDMGFDDDSDKTSGPVKFVYAGPDQMSKRNRTGRVYAGPDQMGLRRPRTAPVYAGPEQMSRMAPVYAGPEQMSGKKPPRMQEQAVIGDAPEKAEKPEMTPYDAPQNMDKDTPAMMVYAGPGQMSMMEAMNNSTMLAYAGPQQLNNQASDGKTPPPWMVPTMVVYAGPDYFSPNKSNDPVVIAASGADFGPAPQNNGFVQTDGLSREVAEDGKTYVICGCCGSKLENPGKFCPECGAKIEKAPAPVENA